MTSDGRLLRFDDLDPIFSLPHLPRAREVAAALATRWVRR
jgi:hypothetical protein